MSRPHAHAAFPNSPGEIIHRQILMNSRPKKYDVAAFIWPSYHPDDRAKMFWPLGIGEWETVLFNKPRYEGH